MNPPVYLSLDVNNSQPILNILEQFAKLKSTASLTEADQKGVEMIIKMMGDRKMTNQEMKVPPVPHVTVCFIGKNKTLWDTKKDNYTTFTEGVEFEIGLDTLFYVPNKILVLSCTMGPDSPIIDNKYAHITLAFNRSKRINPKDSNAVLDQMVPLSLKSEPSILCAQEMDSLLGSKNQKVFWYKIEKGTKVCGISKII